MTDYRLLTIQFTFSDETVDVSHLLRANSYHEDITLCTDEMKSVVNSCSFSLIFDRELFLKVQGENEKIGVLVRDKSSRDTLFTGYLDPVLNTSIYSAQKIDDMTFEVVDTSIDLDVVIPIDLAYPDTVDGAAFKLFDPDDLDNSILNQILSAAGWAGKIDSAVPAILQEVLNVTVAAEEMTWRELLDTLLYEYLHILDVTPEGFVTWKPWATSAIEPIDTITDDDLFSNPPLRPGRQYFTKDGVQVIYPKTAILEDVRLWEGSLPVGDNEGSGDYAGYPGEPIAASDYWPEDSDIQEIWQEYSKEWLDIPYLQGSSRLKNDDLSLIASSGHVITDLKDDGIAVDLSVFKSKRARLRYLNSAVEIQNLYYSKIYGDALIRSVIIKNTLPTTAQDPEKYTSRFIFTAAAAKSLTNALYGLHVFGDMSYSFSSLKEYSPGDFLLLSHKGLEISTVILITGRSRNLGENEVCDYEAIGVSELLDLPVSSSGTQGAINQQRHAPFNLLTQYAEAAEGPWHFTYTIADIYSRSSNDGGESWTAAVRFKGAAAPVYLGALPSVPAPTSVNPRDYFLFIGTTGDGFARGHYYKYHTDGSWTETTESQAIMAGLADALDLAKTEPTIYAATAFVTLLAAQQILITESIRSEKFNADGTENPAGGDAGFFLGANGILKALNGEFTGTVYGTDGFFKGSFETPTIVSEPGTENIYSETAVGGQSQARTMCKNIADIGIGQGVVTKAAGGFNSKTVIHVKYSYSVNHSHNVTYYPIWNGEFPIDDPSNYTYIPTYHTTTTVRFTLTLYFSDGTVLAPFTEITETASDGSGYPDYPTFDIWTTTPTSGSEYTETLELDIYTGGDILKILNIPTSDVGLETGQVYSENGTLKLK